VWDGEIDARHLYAALQLAVYTHERDGSNSNQSHAFSGHYRRESSYDDHVGQIVGQNQASHRLALLAPACVSLRELALCLVSGSEAITARDGCLW